MGTSGRTGLVSAAASRTSTLPGLSAEPRALPQALRSQGLRDVSETGVAGLLGLVAVVGCLVVCLTPTSHGFKVRGRGDVLGWGLGALPSPLGHRLAPSQLPRTAYLQTSQEWPTHRFCLCALWVLCGLLHQLVFIWLPSAHSQGPAFRKSKHRVLGVVSVAPLVEGVTGHHSSMCVTSDGVLPPWVRGRSHGHMPCTCFPPLPSISRCRSDATDAAQILMGPPCPVTVAVPT